MFGLRAWPTPLMKPLWPFMIGSAITVYGVSKMQALALQAPDAKNDPRNPYISSQAKAEAASHH